MAALILAALIPSLRPPEVVSASAPAGSFSAERARVLLREITKAPHSVGSREHDRVRGLLVDTLAALGLRPEVQRTEVAVELWGEHIAGSVQNIVARIPGTASTGAIVLAAHYDAALSSYGATDAGNGVSAIIETARALTAGPRLQNDVIVLLTDAEEVGLLGAKAFVEGHRWASTARVVLNAEGRGAWGPVNMFRTVGESGPLVGLLGESVDDVYATSFTDAAFALLPNDTDLSVFRDAGLVGMDFANAAGVTHYHTPLDNFERSDPRSLQHHGAYMLPLARALASTDLNEIDGPRVVYFDLFGRWLVRYPMGAALPIALGVLLMAMGALMLAVRSQPERARRVVAGAFASLGLVIGVAALAMAAWWAVRWAYPELGGFPHGEPYRSGWVLAGVCLLAGGAFLAGAAALSRRFGLVSVIAGPLVLWAVGGVVVAALLPGMSFLFAWPTLGAALGLALWAGGRPRKPVYAAVAQVALALPTLAILLPLAYLIEVLMLLNAVGVSAFVLAISAALLAVPLSSLWEQWPRAVPLGLVGAGVLLLGGLTLTAGSSPDRPLRTTVKYAVNVDTQEAVWYSWDDDVSEWAEAFLGPVPTKGARPSLELVADRWISEAPVFDLGEPTLEVLSDTTTSHGRRIHVRLRFPEGTAHTTLVLEDSLVARGLTVAGRTFSDATPPGTDFLSYAAPGADGFEIAFTTDAAPTVRLRAVAYLPGLPGTEAPPRPDWMMVGGDETAVHRVFDLGNGAPGRASNPLRP